MCHVYQWLGYLLTASYNDCNKASVKLFYGSVAPEMKLFLVVSLCVAI